MSTGPSGNSAEAPSEPEPPFTGGRRHSWLASCGRHPVTWAIAGVVLIGSIGVALLQQPGGGARTQSVYCGLVKCAVVRSVADSSAAGVSGSTAALPSSGAPSGAPASTPSATPASTPAPSEPKPVAVSKPPAPAPSPTATPAPSPKPPAAPGPPRWPWPPTWGWPPWGGGGGRHHHWPTHHF